MPLTTAPGTLSVLNKGVLMENEFLEFVFLFKGMDLTRWQKSISK